MRTWKITFLVDKNFVSKVMLIFYPRNVCPNFCAATEFVFNFLRKKQFLGGFWNLGKTQTEIADPPMGRPGCSKNRSTDGAKSLIVGCVLSAAIKTRTGIGYSLKFC